MQILSIFLDNGFPIDLIKHQTAVRCLDMNSRCAATDRRATVSRSTQPQKAGHR